MKGREREQGELVLEGTDARIWQRWDIRRYHVSWGVGAFGDREKGNDLLRHLHYSEMIHN